MKRSVFLDQIRRLFATQHSTQSSDAELLARYRSQHDEDAFATLVQRHGPMVWRVCRRMLRDEHLAEDVCQATFLVLARRADAIRRPDALVGWLHGVATRLALKARLQASKLQASGNPAAEPVVHDSLEEMTIRELRATLDEELLFLPDKYRYPLVLCYLEGKTRDEASQQLECPLETLKSRLERGRELLHARLARRRLALSTAWLSLLVTETAVQAGPSASFLVEAARAASHFGTDLAVGGNLSSRAVTLAQGCLTSMKLARLKATVGACLLLGLVIATGLLVGHVISRPSAGTPPPIAQNDVFDGPPAPLVPRLRADLPAANGPLRRLVVEDRVGVRRNQELVRVPLFFHEGECRDPHGLALYALDDRQRQTPIAYQADDIRRAEDGQISRMHIYFSVDLQPWERQQFVLVPGENPGKNQSPLAVKQEADRVTLAGEDLQLSFWTAGSQAGGIAAIQTALGKITLPDGLLAPQLTLRRQAANLETIRTVELSYPHDDAVEVRDLRFGAGPLFAKLVVRLGRRGLPDNAEFTYLVPRTGSLFVQTERLFADDPDDVEVVGAARNALLTGRLLLGNSADEQRVVQVPAGLRRLTRSIQGQHNAALVNAGSRLSLLPIPYVQSGNPALDLGPDGNVSFAGTGDFRRTAQSDSDDLRAFWGQVRFVFSRATTADELWDVGRAHSQPLTAVVDEPGVATDDLHQRLKELMKLFPATHARSWMLESARLYTLDDRPALKKLLDGGNKSDETTAHWLTSATRAHAELTRNGTLPLREADKGKASGLLDPWNLTYSAGPLVSVAALVEPSARLDRLTHAIGQAQRQFNGRVDEYGAPYIDCFHTALSMQVGSIAAGIHGARQSGDSDLLQFFRDCARAPNVLAIFGHGQRTHPVLRDDVWSSDFVYENTSDFFLRAIELACQEDLWLHPSVFGRYFDTVDVNADLYQRTVVPSKRQPSWYRANYFRGQSCDRRWETWSAAPFLGLLGHADDRGAVGLTEACYYARHLSGQWFNWTEITTFFQADVALREGLRRYRPPQSPALPGGVQVVRADGKNVIRWQALAAQDVLGYRVYRADPLGGSWTLLNSPYTPTPRPLVAGREYIDDEGKVGHVYHVTAVDNQRRESRWFPEEPLPRDGQ